MCLSLALGLVLCGLTWTSANANDAHLQHMPDTLKHLLPAYPTCKPLWRDLGFPAQNFLRDAGTNWCGSLILHSSSPWASSEAQTHCFSSLLPAGLLRLAHHHLTILQLKQRNLSPCIMPPGVHSASSCDLSWHAWQDFTGLSRWPFGHWSTLIGQPPS